MTEHHKSREELIQELAVLRGRVSELENLPQPAICSGDSAQEALKQSNAYLENIFDNSPDAIGIVDEHARFIKWNKTASRQFGYSFEELKGKSAFDIYAEKDQLESMLSQLRAKGSVKKYAIDMKRKDGVIATFEISVGLLKDGVRTIGSVCVARNISEIKKALLALEASTEMLEQEMAERRRAEEKYKSIFENAIDGIYQTTLHGTFISANPAFARMLGYDSPENLLRTVTDIPRQLHVSPEQRAELLAQVRKHGQVEGYEVQFYRKDRSLAWILLNMRAVYDEDGLLTHLEGSARDITAHKIAEQEKAALEMRLRQTQKLEAVGTLASGISHDFNNVLGIIMGYADLVCSDLPEGTRERNNLENVLRACTRAKDLIKQILVFSRPDDGMERKALDLNSIVEELVTFLRASLPSTIDIRTDLSQSCGMVLGNSIQLHQVLTNLCTNAAHAMEQKSGFLEISLADMELDVAAVPRYPDIKPGPYVRISVRDTGHGMDQATMERIFDPYFTTKAVGKGTGLGLAVVHGIVKSHQGAVSVYTEPGKGTTFHVYLPRAAGASMSCEEKTDVIRGGTERILFVDDEEFLVDIWQKSLQRLGYQVVGVTSSLEALELFRILPDNFDIVMTDYTMPQKTGAELAEQMIAIRPDIPIALCTGLRENITVTKMKDIGIRSFLMKPLELKSTALEIRRLLDDGV